MKVKSSPFRSDDRPTEAEIREYAHHLYVSSGWLPGRDLDNWLQAESHLIAERKPRRTSHHHPPRARPEHDESQPSI